MLKKATVFSLPLVSILIVILNFKNVQAWLNIPDNGNGLYYFEGIVVLGTLFNYVVTIIIPFLAHVRLAKLRWLIVKQIIDEHISKYPKEFGLTVNVLVPRRKFLKFIRPYKNDDTKRRPSLFPRIFTIVAKSDNSFFPHSFQITSKQFPYGRIFNEMSNTEIFDQKAISSFKFSKKQKEATKKIAVLALCGIKIFELRETGNHPIKLGLLCVESKSKKSLALLNKSGAKELFETHTNLLESQIRHLLS